MADQTEHTGTQGGTHEQHVKAGQQSHKSTPHKEEEKSASESTAHRHVLSKEEEKKGGQNSHSGKH